MFDDLPEFAVRGETGIDIFLRLDTTVERRSRFRCVATVAGARVIDHAPEDRRDAASLRALAQGLADDPLGRPLTLADVGTWPAAGQGGDPIRVFLRLDFFRAWQVAEIAADRLQRQIAADPAALPPEPGKLAGSVAPLLEFNRVRRGIVLAGLALPLLQRRLAAPGFTDDAGGSTGYALRMLGDLCLRGGEAALALACYETAILAGDNPFRRRRAIEAAVVLGDTLAAERNRAAYAARWPLPADLRTA